MLELTDIERAAESVPLVKSVLGRFYEMRFSGQRYAAVRGVFPNFAEARRSAPRTKPIGFNLPEGALDYAERRIQVAPCDYPVLFWLKNILAENQTLFDFGGHVGGHFYAYSRYLRYPPGFRWMVCEVPAILLAGEQMAVREGAPSLNFTDRPEEAEGADIFLAAGSIQYLESPLLSELLGSLKRMPRHLLINKVPLHDGQPFVTLQNNGFSFNPFYVFNRREFVSALESLGYELIDSWNDESRSGRIPFHAEKSFRCYSGLYLRRTS